MAKLRISEAGFISFVFQNARLKIVLTESSHTTHQFSGCLGSGFRVSGTIQTNKTCGLLLRKRVPHRLPPVLIPTSFLLNSARAAERELLPECSFLAGAFSLSHTYHMLPFKSYLYHDRTASWLICMTYHLLCLLLIETEYQIKASTSWISISKNSFWRKKRNEQEFFSPKLIRCQCSNLSELPAQNSEFSPLFLPISVPPFSDQISCCLFSPPRIISVDQMEIKGPKQKTVSNLLFQGSKLCQTHESIKIQRDMSGTMGFNEFKELWAVLNGWRQHFISFDSDKSGTVDPQELQKALTTMGFRLSPQAVNSIAKRYSTNGKITFDDYIACCVKLRALTDSFRRRDTAQQGVVNFPYDDLQQRKAKLHIVKARNRCILSHNDEKGSVIPSVLM
ncbi:hypothetical protein E5288_WYG009083 [Bos mutus]|uniref:EF-hand domain-containing protein n=1 Tax=Bos mutus TaxID=72004 RepID=A0A6B0QZ26_9CETA|nr:hypothetical protein [Bos mutus]